MHILEQCYYGYWFSHTHLVSTTDSWDYTQPHFEKLISASLRVQLGKRLGHWFKKKAETREEKKARRDEVFFILLYICFFFIFLSSQPSPNSWVYNIESKSNEIQTQTNTRNHKAGCKLLSHECSWTHVPGGTELTPTRTSSRKFPPWKHRW